mmetsp:Transcript_70065/g.116351  ORF Transcript_70065/g.116351 Transcript_70065/m.116351 type:complete len:163 (+) Transcript_70065:3-491(+)
MEWDSATQSCRNVLSSIEVQVLYAVVGEAREPDKKIIGSQLLLSSQTVRAARCRFDPSCSTFAFVSASSTFVALPEDGRTYDFVPPLPGMLPRLPADLFYPFVEHDETSTSDRDNAAATRRSRRLARKLVQLESSKWTLAVLGGAPAALLAALLGRRLATFR